MKGMKTLLSYILFIVGLQWKTVYALPGTGTCEEGLFLCKNKECILDLWKCDGEDDCGDNSDEIGCASSSASSTTDCGLGMFQCPNKECITVAWKCDGENDCGDNSDEHNCSATLIKRRPCLDFQCHNGRCVRHSWTCDGSDDCRDGSDESLTDGPFCPENIMCKGNNFQCNKTKKCVDRAFICDGLKDCGEGDNSDEENCESRVCLSDEFRCDNGRCLDLKWKCNRHNECGDSSDEKNCSAKACPADRFKCVTSGHCIRKEYTCDGEEDCLDGSDETACKTTELTTTTRRIQTPVTCKIFEYQCPSDNKCIHTAWLCDGEADCAGMEDESKNACNTKVCAGNEFKCNNDRCVRKRFHCDSIDQCGDKSDEQNCTLPPLRCSMYTYKCHGSDTCIPPNWLCNKRKDCPYGDDESESCGVNECSVSNGKCSHNCTDLPIGYKCTCSQGYEIVKGNPFQCVDINECNVPGACSHICVNYKGSSNCKCNSGYILDPIDHKSCRAEAPLPYLVFTDRFDIRQITTNGRDYNSIASDNIRSAVAVSVDMTDKMIYWADNIKKMIVRIPRDGSSSAEVIVKTGLGKPDGLAVDWIGRKLYWTDAEYNTISVTDLGGKHRKTLIKGNFSELRALTVYPEKGLMFWTDWGDKPKIERASLDGSHRTTIITDVSWPSGITIDPLQNRLYWSDMKRMHICSSDINGKNIKEVVKDVSSPYGLTVFEDFVYWTEFNQRKLCKANKFTGAYRHDFDESFSAPMDVTIYHPLSQTKVSHPCQKNNGLCSHLCFVTSNKNRNFTCACPDDMKLSSNEKSCELITSSDSSGNPVVTTTAFFITGTPTNSSGNPVVTTTASTTPVLCTGYTCHSTKRCIPLKSVCDGKPDCAEHDDETSCNLPEVQPVPEAKKSSKSSTNIYIIAGITVGIIFLLSLIIFIIIQYRKRRTRFDLSMVYEIEREVVHSKDNNKDSKAEIKYVPNSSTLKKNQNKNFENINFKNTDESKIPLQMSEMDGGMMVDEYSGSDNSSDDLCLIPRLV